MTEEEKIKFVMGTLRPMAEATVPFLASVVGVDQDGRFALAGSGFLVRSRETRLLVTAAHVLQEASSYHAAAISAGWGIPPFRLGSLQPVVDPDADLATLELPGGYQPSPDNAFLGIEKFDPDAGHRSKDYLFSHGFPGERGRFLSIEEFGTGLHLKSLPHGAMQRDPPPPDLRPFQFALHYETDGGIPGEPRGQTWLDPAGMSGAPVFRIGGIDAPISSWSPDRSRLVGVLTGWDQEGQSLIASGVERLIALIDKR